MVLRREEFSVGGADLLKAINELTSEATVRRIIICSKRGRPLLELPPAAYRRETTTAIATIAKLAAHFSRCRLDIERDIPASRHSVQ